MMAAITNDEQAALKEVMQMLETTPDSPASSAVPNLLISSNDISNQREKLAVLISTGKPKEAVGVQLTHEQVKRKVLQTLRSLRGQQDDRDPDRQLSHVGQQGGWMIDNVIELQKDLKNDYIINQELSSIAGSLSLRCGQLPAVANNALITTKHIVFKDPDTPPIREPDIMEHAKVETTREGTMHPSRNSEGYPLEGIDEIDE